MRRLLSSGMTTVENLLPGMPDQNSN